MGKKGNYICSKCGKDCGNPPALQLHESYCKGVKKAETKETCEHNFRLLNPNNPAEKMALQDGFINLCTKCKEIE